MMLISQLDLIYLLPILILAGSLVLFLCLLFLLKITTKVAAVFSNIILVIALLSSISIGYLIISSDVTPNNISVDEETSLASIYTNDMLNNHNMISQNSITQKNVEQIENKLESNPGKTKNQLETTTHTKIEKTWRASYITPLFTCDGYGLLYVSLILFVSFSVSLFATDWFKHESTNQGIFYFLILLSALGGVTLAYASHLISFFIGLELLAISFIGLIGYSFERGLSIEAAIKYMLLSVVATSFLLLGIAFYYTATGELTFSGLSFLLSTLSAPSPLFLLGVCLMLVGVGFKLSLFPFQLWFPDVYQGAPSMVSLLITSIGKVAVFCAVARLFLLAPVVNNDVIHLVMVLMAFFSIVLGSLFAAIQSNVKRLVAYSSIAHFGYLLIALIAVQYQVLVLETIGVYLVGYIFANICVLGGISLESSSINKKDKDDIFDFKGLFWRKPIMALSMTIGLLSLAGIPLTVGFIGRFSIMLLGITAELWLLVGTLIIGVTCGLYFYLRLVINLFSKSSGDENSQDNKPPSFAVFRGIGFSELMIMFSALVILFCGIYPKWLFYLVNIAQYLTAN